MGGGGCFHGAFAEQGSNDANIHTDLFLGRERERSLRRSCSRGRYAQLRRSNKDRRRKERGGRDRERERERELEGKERLAVRVCFSERKKEAERKIE